MHLLRGKIRMSNIGPDTRYLLYGPCRIQVVLVLVWEEGYDSCSCALVYYVFLYNCLLPLVVNIPYCCSSLAAATFPWAFPCSCPSVLSLASAGIAWVRTPEAVSSSWVRTPASAFAARCAVLSPGHEIVWVLRRGNLLLSITCRRGKVGVVFRCGGCVRSGMA